MTVREVVRDDAFWRGFVTAILLSSVFLLTVFLAVVVTT